MKIIKRETLSESLGVKITKLEVSSGAIVQKARPGQFVSVMVSEIGERIPLTIVDKNEIQGKLP